MGITIEHARDAHESARQVHPAGSSLSRSCGETFLHGAPCGLEDAKSDFFSRSKDGLTNLAIRGAIYRREFQMALRDLVIDERGDVPGWVLVVLMTTGLVTGIWTIAAPKIESLLRGSLDSMNSVR